METYPFGLAPVQFGWDLADPAYYNAGVFPTSYPGHWGNVALTSRISAPGTVTTYAAVAQAGSNTVADLTDTFDDLDAFKAAGGKMITFVGANDALIMPRGVINYYRVMADALRGGVMITLRMPIRLTASEASRNSTGCSMFPE